MSTSASTYPGGRLRLAALGGLHVWSWATTVYTPAIFGEAIGRDIGVSLQFVHAGVTAMLLVNALAAAPTGYWIAASGPRVVLVAGSLLMGLGALLLAAAQGPASYLAAWFVLGLATPMALGQAAAAVILRFYPDKTRQGFAAFAIIGAFAPALGWPLLWAMEGLVDWRTCNLIFAVSHIVVAAPIAALAAPDREAPSPKSEGSARPGEWSPGVLLIALSFALTSFAT